MTTPEPATDPLVQAIAYEEGIGEEAKAIRGEDKALTPALLLKLWPLLRRPIPAAFIETLGKLPGKPYESTGIRSVQVQFDRMDRVLTPLWWRDEATYSDDGQLCHVTIIVGTNGSTLYARDSWGGVDRASTRGNLRKGAFTNAAKLALARVGPGWEIYIGATDFDPDVSEQMATAAPADTPDKIGRKLAKELVDRAWDIGVKDKLRLAASHAAGSDIGDCDTKAKATAALAELGFQPTEKLDAWLGKKADEASADQPALSEEAAGGE